MVHSIRDAQGYSDARGIYPARDWRSRSRTEAKGVTGVGPDDVFLGNGVSELIVMALQGLLEPGDEVLIPSPDYPLWTGAVGLCGGRAVHYRCEEQEGWAPDLGHVAEQITPRTRALVIINPNNPTGAVYSTDTLLGLLDLARRHGLLVLTDEIYDQILYEDAVHESAAALAPDLLVLSLGGLSKTYRLAGFRSGWLVVSRPAPATRPSTSRAWNCWPTCGCARTSRRSTRSCPRSAGKQQHPSRCCSPAGGCASSATTPGG